jgi:hypothetical protein
MPIDEKDIWRTANLYIERFGEEAAIQAAMKVDEMLAKGDMEGRSVWRRVLEAIEKLQAKEPPKGTPTH